MRLNEHGGRDWTVRDSEGRFIRLTDDGLDVDEWVPRMDMAQSWPVREDLLDALMAVGLADCVNLGELERDPDASPVIRIHDGLTVVPVDWVNEEDL